MWFVPIRLILLLVQIIMIVRILTIDNQKVESDSSSTSTTAHPSIIDQGTMTTFTLITAITSFVLPFLLISYFFIVVHSYHMELSEQPVTSAYDSQIVVGQSNDQSNLLNPNQWFTQPASTQNDQRQTGQYPQSLVDNKPGYS
jgi:hypothetical protein